MVSSEIVRLVIYTIGLYGAFMLWGYLQERITSTKYAAVNDPGNLLEWDYPVALNMAMAAATFLTASIIELVRGETGKVPLHVFW